MDLNGLIWWSVLGGSLASFLADLRAHWINRDFLEFAGSYELEIGTRLSMAYFTALHGLVLLGLGMVFWRDASFSGDLSQLSGGFVLIIAGFVGRQWAMRSIGRLWSIRCLYIPSMPLEGRGLYRVFSHPEYICRGLESLGVLVVLGIVDHLWPIWIAVMVMSLILALAERRFVTTYALSAHRPEGVEVR